MALSPDAAALKEQALHAADLTLVRSGRGTIDTKLRAVIAAMWLDGYRTGQAEKDRYVDEAHNYLLGLAS